MQHTIRLITVLTRLPLDITLNLESRVHLDAAFLVFTSHHSKPVALIVQVVILIVLERTLGSSRKRYQEQL